MAKNIAVIGVGYWGRKHVDEWRFVESANMQVICDPNEDALKEVQELYKVPEASTDYKEILQRDDIEAVSICTNNEMHYRTCKEALEAGKNVLVEKPITLDSRRAKELVKLAKENDLVLAVGHIYRFNNAINKIRELAQQKFFGNIYYIKSQWTTMMPPIKGRDIIFDLAPHSFDILHYILDEWPRSLVSVGKSYRRPELEEAAFLTAEYSSNVLGQIELSWMLPGKVREITVIGSERQAVVECLSQNIMVYESGYKYDLGIERNNTIRDELSHFVQCIDNHELATNSGEVGVKTIELIEASRKSIEEDRKVYLK